MNISCSTVSTRRNRCCTRPAFRSARSRSAWDFGARSILSRHSARKLASPPPSFETICCKLQKEGRAQLFPCSPFLFMVSVLVLLSHADKLTQRHKAVRQMYILDRNTESSRCRSSPVKFHRPRMPRSTRLRAITGALPRAGWSAPQHPGGARRYSGQALLRPSPHSRQICGRSAPDWRRMHTAAQSRSQRN